ncbi:unnamed protein product, partial [marine sediment metagenome]
MNSRKFLKGKFYDKTIFINQYTYIFPHGYNINVDTSGQLFVTPKGSTINVNITSMSLGYPIFSKDFNIIPTKSKNMYNEHIVSHINKLQDKIT